jgi:histidinol dehydrogenase
LTAGGILNLGKTVELMAEAEGLDAHKNAISVRLENLVTKSQERKLSTDAGR